MNNLSWTIMERKEVLRCPIFSLEEARSRSPKGEISAVTRLNAPDWAIIIPLIRSEEGDSFVLVRQWRHGADSLSLEFPGGVFEGGESPGEAAVRELQEETGYIPGTIREIAQMNANPAFQTNRLHFFLAQDLRDPGPQNLDPDEFVDVEIVPAEALIRGMGRPPFIHALMAAALSFYLRDLKA
jgi:8-oxo-dGTP pyrophosphatase MutT (NUDIX family)